MSAEDIKKSCVMCKAEFPAGDLDFLERCEPCFRKFLAGPLPDYPILFQSTGNKHYSKETRARKERMERKRWTPQGVDHNYVKRAYV